MSYREGKLVCDMKRDCNAAVAYIDEKGYAYCAPHGISRKQHCRCRKLRSYEVRRLERGDTVLRYFDRPRAF